MGLLKRKISEYVTRHPLVRGATDSQGNEIESFGPDEPGIGIFGFDPGGSSVQEPGREAYISSPTIYMPFGSPFRHQDECTVRGKRYTVEGDPADWVHNTYGPIGDAVKLRRADG